MRQSGRGLKRTAIGSFLAGAACMYFTDPSRGRRRRAVARDKVIAGWHDVGNELEKAGRDLSNRTHGMVSAASSLCSSKAADAPVLLERVRSATGRAVSHPHAVHVCVEENGRIILDGPVLQHEQNYLLKRVSAAPGVREVVNRLQVYAEPGNISSLQGGVPRRELSEFAQQNWTPSWRIASSGLGGAAVLTGIRNRGPWGWAGAIGGAALMARAIVNKPFRRLLGLSDAGVVDFDKTIHFDAPLEEVYAFWANFENFPKFMTHLKEVCHLKEGRSHWVAAGPGGISIPWDAEITEQRNNELLAWTSVPGSLIRTAGLVRFDKEPDGRTRVQIRMSYCPPAGVFGHAVAWMFGADPKSEMDDDLVRLKSLLEFGKTRAHGVVVTREEVPVTQPGAQQQAW